MQILLFVFCLYMKKISIKKRQQDIVKIVTSSLDFVSVHLQKNSV